MTARIRVARYPIRPISGRWPRALEARARRFFWCDPAAVLDVDVNEERYRIAMNAFSMGDTIKITQRDRHPQVDDLLLAHADLVHADIVDIGASDGTTSVDLIERLGAYNSYTVADLHLFASAARVGRRTVFLQADGECFLVAGPRFIAWPRESRVIRCLYRSSIAKAKASAMERVLLVNPRARHLAAHDSRIRFAVHDVFEPWPQGPVDVIKVANLLRADYFTPEQLVSAFGAILASLRDGGHLLVANNLRTRPAAVGGALFRKHGDRFELIASVGDGVGVDVEVLAARQ